MARDAAAGDLKTMAAAKIAKLNNTRAATPAGTLKPRPEEDEEDSGTPPLPRGGAGTGAGALPGCCGCPPAAMRAAGPPVTRDESAAGHNH